MDTMSTSSVSKNMFLLTLTDARYGAQGYLPHTRRDGESRLGRAAS